jgi:NitT/TauT family transport system ATP-binding protein
MKMRASLARSLTLSPNVFLFDEPFVRSTRSRASGLNDELLALFHSQGFASLFITHSIYEAVFLSTRGDRDVRPAGRIVGDFDVPFEYPRSHDLRFESEFAEVTGRVSHALRGAHS